MTILLRRKTKARMLANIRRRQIAQRLGQVYFVQAEGTNMVKIGFAIRVHKRMSALAIGCPVPLILRAVIDGPPALEGEIHKRFAADRTRGEWFRITPAMEDFWARA